MKKIISILLVVAIISCLAIPAFAQESEEPQYGTVKVEYSDSRGSIEKLEVMVLDDYVYANVDSFSIRLGYCYEQKENVVSIYTFTDLWGDQTPALALHFRIGDTTVSYNPLCGIEIEYTAPAPCVQNDRGIWVPLSYTLTLLGGSRNIAGDVLVIQMPSHNILSIAAMIANNGEALSFDWTDDFGYSETVTSVMDGAGRVVTLFSGLLEFDGRAWSSFVDWNAFDKKFGKTLATMLCTNSTDELKESIEEIELLEAVFDSDGALGSVLQTQKIQIDSNVDTWKTICEEQLEKLKTGSGTLPQYNMAYQQYERATKEQDLFSAVGADRMIHIQEELSSATNVLDKAAKIGYVVSCLEEFQQRDSFQATVLKDYFATRKDTDELPNATANAIADYASSNIVEYTAKKFCEEHLLEILVDETGLDVLMGAPANILLLAWDIMSETIPFYSDGLASVESREISNYAQQVQNDAFENINTLISSLRADSASLSPEECVQLAEYCYVYLKACYVARSSAIESLDNVSEETQDILEGSINKENEINRKISKYLSILSRAEKGNSCYILGFLPENNNELLGMYSDDALLNNVVDLENDFGSVQKRLTQIKAYKKIGDLDALTNLMTFHYGENGYLQSIDDEQFSETGGLSNKGTVLIEMDAKGRMTKREPDMNLEWDYEYVEYNYNDRDQLISSDTTKYYYDERGNLTKQVTSIGDFTDTKVVEFLHDDGNLIITKNTTWYGENETSPYIEEIHYIIDEHTRIIEENNITRSQVTEYDYDYWPVVTSKTMLEGNYGWGGFEYVDSEGHSIFTIGLNDMEFFTDDEGCLIKIAGEKNRVPYTYEFIYEQSQGNIEVESFPYDHNEIGNMVAKYYNENMSSSAYPGTYVVFSDEIVVIDNKCNVTVRFQGTTASMSNIYIADVSVIMSTGKIYINGEFLGYLWDNGSSSETESYPHDHEEIADMIRGYYVDDWEDGCLLVIFRSEFDGKVYYSVKFDPDDPAEYPEGLSMPVAEITVDMKTGEMFSYNQSQTFLW